MKTKKKIIVLMLMAEILLLGSFEGVSSAEDIELEPIVVTATKTARRICDVPSSVSVVTKREIEESQAKNVTDLLAAVGGAVVYDSSGVGTEGRINMRGFWGGMSTHNLVLVDGVPINSVNDKLVNWNLVPLETIERIEIIRGPASALYGDAAFAGTINIITKKGGVIPEIKVYSSYGSFKTQQHRVTTSGTKGNTGYFFNLSKKSTDGFREHADYEDIHFGQKLNFFFDPTFNAELSLGYYQSLRGCLNWSLTEAQMAENRNQARPGTEDDRGKDIKANLGITLRKDTGETSSFESKLYIRDEDSHSFGTTSGGSTREHIEDDSTLGINLQYETIPRFLGRDNSLIIGTDLERDDCQYKQYNAPNQIRTTARSSYIAVRKKVGIYVQDEIKVTPPLSLTLGLRRDDSYYDFIDHRDNSKSKTRSLSAISPKVGTVYVYKKNSSIYSTIARAFRTPTIGQMFTYTTGANPDLNPEEADNYEVGLRHQFADFLAGSLSLYKTEIDNEIWYDADTKEYKNYGQTEHKGIESALDVKLGRQWKGFANYTYTRAKNESGTYKDKYLAHVPEHKGNLGLKFKGDNRIGINLFLNWVGRSYLDSGNTEQLGAYTTMDAKVSYEGKKFSLFLAVDNLLDTDYCLYGIKSSPTATAKFDPAPGRTWTFGLEAKF